MVKRKNMDFFFVYVSNGLRIRSGKHKPLGTIP